MKIFHSNKVMVFSALNLADFALTWWLLSREDGCYFESNPIAQAWLHTFGWLGLLMLKGLSLAVVVGTCQLIARSRPHLSAGLLNLGCAIVLAVVGYSAYLGFLHGDGSSEEELAEIQLELDDLDRQQAEINDYHALTDSVTREYLQERLSFNNAVLALCNHPHAHNERFRQGMLRILPGRSDAECFAFSFALEVILSHDDSETSARLVQRVYEDYRREFKSTPPWTLEQLQTLGRTKQLPSGSGKSFTPVA